MKPTWREIQHVQIWPNTYERPCGQRGCKSKATRHMILTYKSRSVVLYCCGKHGYDVESICINAVIEVVRGSK